MLHINKQLTEPPCSWFMPCLSAALAWEYRSACSERPPYRHHCTSPSTEATSWASVKWLDTSFVGIQKLDNLLPVSSGRLDLASCPMGQTLVLILHKHDGEEGARSMSAPSKNSAHWGWWFHFYGVYSSSVCHTCLSPGG